ncbi:hypothetical protein D046_3201, partial [Vibrio parahaemolyticus V-223/04]
PNNSIEMCKTGSCRISNDQIKPIHANV